MTGEFEKYIPEIQALDINFIPESHRLEARRVLGDWVFNVHPTDKDLERTRKYLEGKLKRNLEKVLAVVIHNMAGKHLSTILSKYIERVDPPSPGIFTYKAGLTPGNILTIEKVRSLKTGAFQALNRSPFSEAMWHRDQSYLKPWLIPGIGKVIRSGIDESPQLKKVISGEMAVISPRALLLSELRGFDILNELRDHPSLGFSTEIKSVLPKHHAAMQEQGVKPGIVNPISALNLNGDSSPMLRLLAGYAYATSGASLSVDMRMAISSISRRARRLVEANQIIAGV